MDSDAKSSSPQRFNVYLNGLQEEFELQCHASFTKSMSARRFNIYLVNLKGEFELMSLENESLRKERDEYKVKVENSHRNIKCRQCSKEIESAPQIATSMKTTSLASEANPGTSDALRGVNRHQQKLTHTTPTQKSHSQPSASTHSGLKGSNWVIDQGEKQLHVELAHVSSHKMTICCVKFSQDGKSLAVGCKDGKAYIYGVETGELICVLRNLLAKDDQIRAICFSHDGKCLATGTRDHGDIYIWEIKTKYLRNAFRGRFHFIMSLDFSLNDRTLVSASEDNTVRLWNMRDGSAKLLIEDTPTFLGLPLYCSVVFNPDGRYVAASHRDGIVRIWDVRTGRLLRRINAHIIGWATTFKFMPDGKGLVSASASGEKTLKYWNIASLDDGCFHLRSRATNALQGHISGVEEQTQPEREFSGHKNRVSSLAVSPDGTWVASGSTKRNIRIWDTRNAAMQGILDNVHEKVRSLDFSPAGRYFASGGAEGMVRIWRYSYMTPGEKERAGQVRAPRLEIPTLPQPIRLRSQP